MPAGRPGPFTVGQGRGLLMVYGVDVSTWPCPGPEKASSVEFLDRVDLCMRYQLNGFF